MQDRRSAFPGREPATEAENNRSILDAPFFRKENAPIEFVHKRYLILLLVGTIAVGAFSFFSPCNMMRALQYDKQETAFTYAMIDGSYETAADLPAATEPLPIDAVSVLKSYSTSHILQEDAVFNGEAILIYPAESTNYALYVTKETSYVFAIDRSKFRYTVTDDGTFYEAISAALP